MDPFRFTALAVLATLWFGAQPALADANDTASTVANCRANHENCKNSLGLAVVLESGDTFCAPKDMVMPTDAEIDGVLSWLEAHPDVHPDDWAAASDAALAALYPCSQN